MKELIAVQVGTYANFVGSHFWNLQDEFLGLRNDPDADPYLANSGVNFDVLYRVGETTQNPRFLAFLQPPLPSQQVGSQTQMSEPVRAQAQVLHTANSAETSMRLSESMQTSRPTPIVQEQVYPPPFVHPGYFGGGSVFQTMAVHAPGNQYYTPETVFGGAQGMMPNPMYGSIGMQPGFQSTQGQFGMPQANFGMAGIFNQQPYMASSSQNPSG
ncbi:hypothetical protein L7F22_050925 [Adiantum nelumboides]|nr:hypothetical protein [Adiantum nelumboides]